MTPIDYYKSHMPDRKAHLEAVAAAAGTNLAYLEQLCRGYRTPSIKKAKKLVLATNGQVLLEDWLPELKSSAA